MTGEQALALLTSWSAPQHVVRHARLVAGVAQHLCALILQDDVALDAEWVHAAAVLHDVGKIVHPEELHRPGHLHEDAGQAMLLAHGLDPALCRICVSHARWRQMTCSLEELVVVLADKLWKGKRIQYLEEVFVREMARRMSQDFWHISPLWDTRFEEIAAQSDARLIQSATSLP